MKGRKTPDSEGIPVINVLGVNIRRARKLAKLTGTDLALAVGRSKQSVSDWERGDHPPDIWLVPRIAESLGVSSDFLFEGTIQMPSRGSPEWVLRRLLMRLGVDRLRGLNSISLEEIDAFLATHGPGGDAKSRASSK